jgi:hypothetical protein
MNIGFGDFVIVYEAIQGHTTLKCEISSLKRSISISRKHNGWNFILFYDTVFNFI